MPDLPLARGEIVLILAAGLDDPAGVLRIRPQRRAADGPLHMVPLPAIVQIGIGVPGTLVPAAVKPQPPVIGLLVRRRCTVADGIVGQKAPHPAAGRILLIEAQGDAAGMIPCIPAAQLAPVLAVLQPAAVFIDARHGDFILRIEDTDRTRFVPDAVDFINRTLDAAHIIPDEGPDIGGDCGPYIQSERMRMAIWMPWNSGARNTPPWGAAVRNTGRVTAGVIPCRRHTRIPCDTPGSAAAPAAT